LPIDNTDDQYEILFEGPDDTPFGNFYVTATYSRNGMYDAQYVPQRAGVYKVTIMLLGYLGKEDQQIKGSPFTVVVYPGEILP